MIDSTEIEDRLEKAEMRACDLPKYGASTAKALGQELGWLHRRKPEMTPHQLHRTQGLSNDLIKSGYIRYHPDRHTMKKEVSW